ncbi:MAG: TOBE domain-containing protein, partial [Tabrizicola sp.]
SPKMNFLTGKFAEAEGCTTLGVRSEHIEVVDNGPWSGEVLHVEDLGSDHFLFVEIGSDEPVIVRRPGKATIPVGTRLSIAPKPGHLYRFDRDGKPVR